MVAIEEVGVEVVFFKGESLKKLLKLKSSPPNQGSSVKEKVVNLLIKIHVIDSYVCFCSV